MNDPHDTTAGASGTTWVYTYDRGGNILSKSYYAYTTGTPGTAVDTIAYSYTDSNWKDKLTSYDGNAITYDAIGNPLNDGTWTYTWEKGRQLKQMSKAGMTVEFKYDHNGLRTQKKVTSGGEVTVTDYTLHGKLVTHLTRGSDEMHFFYDAQSRPAMVKFNGALYSYVHNLQGDIVGIVDSAGSLVVEYKYAAWGKPTLVRTLTTAYEALAELNPFRYRGYVYDEETGLYYLRSRYYHANIMRFINSDVIICLSMKLMHNNMMFYCQNNPVLFSDKNGRFFSVVVNKLYDAGMDFLIDKYAKGVKDEERELIKAHPFAALQVYWAKSVAETVTKGLFGDNWNSDDTKENAFKHCLWNALMSYKIGEDLAREFGNAHEAGMMESHPESTSMDYHNNEVGYHIASYPPTEDELDKEAFASYAMYSQIYSTSDWKIYIIIDRAYEALENGTLYYIK